MGRHVYSVLDDAERPTVDEIVRWVATRPRPVVPRPRGEYPPSPGSAGASRACGEGGPHNRVRVVLDGSAPLTVFRGDLSETCPQGEVVPTRVQSE
jgi:hypothetical protein